MRAVKPKGNKTTEEKLIEIFKLYDITGWRRHYKLFGRPDFVFLEKRIVVFADGCFWHGHDCRNLTPSDNAEFWSEKIEKNRSRDQAVTDELTRIGWQVIRIWECEITRGDIRKLVETDLFPGNQSRTTENT